LPHSKITLASTADVQGIIRLSDIGLGLGWLSPRDLHHPIRGQRLFVFKREGHVIGFILFDVLNKDKFQSELLGNSYILPDDLSQHLNTQTLGILKTIVVHPDYQRLGIGAKLVSKALEALSTNDVRRVVSFGWKTESAHIGPTLLKVGFKAIYEFKEFWHEHSLKHGYDCTNCGHPCKCNAVLFFKSE